ncbi:MAG: carboxy terminal-processing peptidase [Chloroherpetonaceae bacterium]|nr:carboxy terminal-processing peptidase [Chthonomonadaceae bacterium]MDW8206931.1 carboxy terminal-processing peptidase [Chloroherpetonaceae bacterium]
MKTNARLIVPALALGVLLTGCALPFRPAASLKETFVMNAPREAALASQQPGSSGTKVKTASDLDNRVTAKMAARILSSVHYLKKPLKPDDPEMTARFLNNYLDALDPMRLYFLQSDVAEFEAMRTKMVRDLVDHGDVSAAYQIFKRFMERFDAQLAYVHELLKTGQFTFDGDDTFIIDRKQQPRPATLEEAKKLWRDRLRYEYLQEKLNQKKPEEIVSILTRRYNRIARTLREQDSDDIFELYMNALAHVYDPHTDYMGRATNEDFEINMRLSLFGIGALLGSEDGYCKIMELIPGGPAERSKQLKVGDRIVAVAQGDGEPVDVIDMKNEHVVSMIRGPKGTTVRLIVIPADATDMSTRKVVTLVREEIKLEEQAAKARLIEYPAPAGKTLRLGIIDLPSFYEDMSGRGRGEHKSTTTDVARLIRKLKAENVDGIILDLRRNGGGSLEEAIRLTGLFIKQGPIVQIRDPDGSVEVRSDPDPGVLYDGPLAVLISKASASASEILAGALQDYDRAVIIGDNTTFGKGTVQAVMQLAPILKRYNLQTETDPGALKLTIQKFYRPGGHSTQLKGVAADVVIPSVYNYSDVGEKSLKNPLPWDTIDPTPFTKLNRVHAYLNELRARSQARAKTDPDLLYRQRLVQQYRKAREQKTVSLNEAQRLKEKAELEAQLKARKAELAARPPSREKIYEITLKNVDQPGLPAPIAPGTKKVARSERLNTPDGETPPDAAEAETPEVDITLDETKRILADFIELTTTGKPVARNR